MKKWRYNRFGQFIHWGIYSLLGGQWKGKVYDYASEWIKVSAHISNKDYDQLVHRFDPVKFNPTTWARRFKQEGVKYVISTTKHHDGFCMWDSKYTTFDMGSTPYGKGLLKPLADAVRAEGLDMGFYYSIIDWHNPDYRYALKTDADRAAYRRYLNYMKNQLKELLTNFGDIKILWFDGRWDPSYKNNPQFGKEIEAWCRKIKPDIIINDRVRAYDDLADYDSQYERRLPKGKMADVDWECCMTMPSNTWGYHKFAHDWKSPKQIVEMLVRCTAKNGNFLLNIGPKPDGTLRKEETDRMKAIGRWMAINSQAIYGAGKYALQTPKGIYVTRRDNHLYLHIFKSPQTGKIIISNLKARPLKIIELKNSLPVSQWYYADSELTIQLPVRLTDPIATVLKLDFRKGQL